MRAQVIWIQEIHFKMGHIPKFTNKHFPVAFHATSAEVKMKGVTILLSKNTDFHLHETKVDPEGRYLFLRGQLGSRPLTIANIYSPNSGQVNFSRQLCRELSDFTSGIFILGGDLNVSLNPLWDTSMGTSSIPYKALRQINLQLQNL